MCHAQLNLYRNEIGNEGAAAIGDALKVNGSLTSLNLANNSVCGILGNKVEGIAALAEALKINGSLTSLDVRANKLDDASKGQLQDIVKDQSGFALQV